MRCARGSASAEPASSGRVHAARVGDVLTLTIDRPGQANAPTAAMLGALADAVEAAPRDLRMLVLKGAGDRSFRGGADLGQARAGLARSPDWERLLPDGGRAERFAGGRGVRHGAGLRCRLAVPRAAFH